jgi:alpha-mannosidase
MALMLPRSVLRQMHFFAIFSSCLLLSLLVGLFPVYSHAQSELPERALKELQQLPPAAQTAVRQLAALGELPPPQWKMHSADIAHGEAVNLDDSGWDLAKLHAEGPREAVWYRATIEVPKDLNGYDLTGAKIWFDFNIDIGGGSGSEIVYFNGRRVAMGEDLERMVLFNEAKPGDKVVVAVKLPPSPEPKFFDGSVLKVDAAPGRPDPEMLWKEIFSAGGLAPAISSSGADVLKQVESASTAVNFDVLHQGDQKAFDASLTKAGDLLAVVNPQLKTFSLQLTGNSHIDAAWLWPWTETVDVVRRTFGTTLQLMDEYPELHFAQSAAQYSEWIEQKYPAMFKEIVERAKQNRWEAVGGMWIEPDLNMPDGESLVRQLLIGKRYFKEKYGQDVRIGWNPDSFGYNWQLPQIYKKSGVDYFVTQKMSWNDTNKLPLKLFWWQSPDGSRVLTYFPYGYSEENQPLVMAYDLRNGKTLTPGLTEELQLFGNGDHGGGPTRTILDRGILWSDPHVSFPKLNFGSAQGFFDAVQPELDTANSPVWNYSSVAAEGAKLPAAPAGKIELPVWNDELYLEFHRGVFTTQSDLKRNMRDSEEWMLNAEKYSSLAWLEGDSYPASQFNEAWKKVLFNQFHDLAAGSGIGIIYKDAQHDYDVVHWTAEEADAKAWHTLTSEMNTRPASPTAVPVVIWNPLGWARKADLVTLNVQMHGKVSGGISVLDPQGNALPVQILSRRAETNTYQLLIEAKSVPSLGYAVLHVAPAARTVPTDLKVHGLTLENAALRVTVDPKSGCITSLYDKKSQFESLAAGACGNELIAFQDKPKEYDAWNIDADFEKVSTPLDHADSVELIEKGPLRATIRVTHAWQSSKFVQDIVLYAGLDRVDVVNNIDWHETHILLKAAFPLAASSNQATYEIPYGTIERPTTRNNSWEAAKFEVPALRWADLGDGKHGFSLINESKYGYDAKGNVLRISLLRSPTSPDPNADRGHHHFAYSLYPHAGDWKEALTIRHGYEFNYKLHGMQVMAHEGKLPAEHSYAGINGDNVVLTAMKKTEDGDALLLRFYEWAGKTGNVELTVSPGATSAKLASLMEEGNGDDLPLKGNQISVPVHPFEIVTVRVTYSPHQ